MHRSRRPLRRGRRIGRPAGGRAGGRRGGAPGADRRHPARAGTGWAGAFSACSCATSSRGRRSSRSSWCSGWCGVAALIGVGVASALAVAAVKQGEPYTQYLVILADRRAAGGVLHWLESWFAHDMAFRTARGDAHRALREARPARTGLVRPPAHRDLVAMATHDVELVEYFFAHTVAPFFVAVLVPAVVIGTLGWFGWRWPLP